MKSLLYLCLIALTSIIYISSPKLSRAAIRFSTESAMFRGGPEHTGVYGSASGNALVGLQWRVATDGDIISSPVISDQTVYVGSGDGRLYALNLMTGEQQWAFSADSAIPSSPAVGAGRVYFGTRQGIYYAVDAKGALQWKFKTGPDCALAWGHESGDYYVSSPTYVAGVVVFGAGDGQVYAVDAKTGKERWRTRTEGRVRSTPAVSEGRVYVGSMDGRIYCFDLASGRVVWSFETEGVKLNSAEFGFDRRTIQASPAVSGGTVFIGSRDGSLYALDTQSGKLRWRVSHKTSWIITSPAVADGKVYIGSSDSAFVQALDANTGEEIWQQKIGTVIWSSLAVSGNALYFGDRAGRFLAIDRSNGHPLWTFRTSGPVFSSPTVSGDLVIFGSGDGGVYALRVGARSTQRAVFFDAAYQKAASFDSELMARYFQNRGYQRLDTAALVSFLRARIADREPSVVVFAIDYSPAEIVKPIETALLKQYLEAGGKVVWPGTPPLLWEADPATGQRGSYKTVNWTATGQLLGVDHHQAIFDARGVRPTAEGRRWGLSGRWRDAWGVDPKGVTYVLGMDEWGLAATWVKSYGGASGTGFVRVHSDDPLTVFLLAEYRPIPN